MGEVKKAQWNCLTRQPHLPFPVGSKTAKTKKTYKNKSTKTHYKKGINREEKTKRTYFYALLSIKKGKLSGVALTRSDNTKLLYNITVLILFTK